MAEQSLKDKTAKGLFWGGVSNGVQQLLGMLFGIYLARILNAEDYGLVGMLAIFSGIAGTIINSGFTVALTNNQNATHKDYNAVFWFTFFIGLILYLVLFLAAPLISEFYHRPELTALSRVLFISFFVSGIASVPYTVMFKRLMVKEQAKIDILSLFFSGIIGVSLALNGFAYWAIALQSMSYVTINSLLKCYVSPWRPTFEFDFSPLRHMFSFSVKLFLTNVFTQINTNIFSVLLGRFYDARQVGFYSQGNKWQGMGNTFISGMINSVAQPVLVSVGDDLCRQRNVFRKMVRFGSFVSFPVMLGLAFVGKEFICVLIGDKWLPSVPFLQLFCIWGAVSFLWNLYSNLLISPGKSDLYMWGIVFVGMIQLLCVFAFLRYGIYYMLGAYISVYFLGILFWHYFASRLICLGLIYVIKDMLPYLFATFLSFFIVWVLTYQIEDMLLLLILKIVLSVLSYVVIMWLGNSVIFKEALTYLRKK